MTLRTIPEILLILMLYEWSVVIRLCKQELSSVALYLIDFFIVCRFQELKAIEQLVSLLSEQPEEVLFQRLLALIPDLALNMTFIVEFNIFYDIMYPKSPMLSFFKFWQGKGPVRK